MIIIQKKKSKSLLLLKMFVVFESGLIYLVGDFDLFADWIFLIKKK